LILHLFYLYSLHQNSQRVKLVFICHLENKWWGRRTSERKWDRYR